MLTPNIDLRNKTVLVTGAAGFIGANLVCALLRAEPDIHIVGLDNLNAYYDVSIKEYRLSELEKQVAATPGARWTFVRGDLSDRALMDDLFKKYGFAVVVTLAA
jgi:nucleoside-diphosphate-sugar epimerase